MKEDLDKRAVISTAMTVADKIDLTALAEARNTTMSHIVRALIRNELLRAAAADEFVPVKRPFQF